MLANAYIYPIGILCQYRDGSYTFFTYSELADARGTIDIHWPGDREFFTDPDEAILFHMVAQLQFDAQPMTGELRVIKMFYQ